MTISKYQLQAINSETKASEYNAGRSREYREEFQKFAAEIDWNKSMLALMFEVKHLARMQMNYDLYAQHARENFQCRARLMMIREAIL